jgi:hypothetical protein
MPRRSRKVVSVTTQEVLQVRSASLLTLEDSERLSVTSLPFIEAAAHCLQSRPRAASEIRAQSELNVLIALPGCHREWKVWATSFATEEACPRATRLKNVSLGIKKQKELIAHMCEYIRRQRVRAMHQFCCTIWFELRNCKRVQHEAAGRWLNRNLASHWFNSKTRRSGKD